MDSRDLNLGYLHRSASVSATSLIQLACDFDNRVYLVDVIALKQDCGERLVKILGNLFANPSVRKIAYDWQADKARLEFTFPALQHRCYQMENLVDLRYVWLHYRYCGPVQPDADSGPISSSSFNNTLNNYHNVDSRSVLPERRMRSPRRVDILAWSTLSKNPGLMSRCWGAGLSGILLRLCGLILEKTQQCSDWEHRPLSEQQKTYAGEDRVIYVFGCTHGLQHDMNNMLIMAVVGFSVSAIDARCLLDINQILAKAQRIE
ncbi:Exonuclease mut-7 [Mortierella alpina]|nr:Exonuclease mut-7 [Mortierella alpina]